MPGGLNPYIGFNQQQRMGAYGGGAGYGAGGGYGGAYGGGYGRMANTEGAVTGPVGSSSGFNPQAQAEGKEQMLEQRERAQQTTGEIGAFRQQQASQFQADQAKSVADYRAARDNGIGRDSIASRNNTRAAAIQAGIDPSSDAATVAAAQSGGVHFDGQGMPTGGDTGQHINNPTQPAPASTPGAVQPNEADMVAAARAAQLAKTGQAGSAYAGGASPPATGQQPTGANPYTAGIAPHAVQPMGDPDAARKAVAMGVPPPPASSQPGVTLRPMAGVPAQPATQPPQQPAPPQHPIAPVTGRMMSLRPPVPAMSIPRSPALATGPGAPPMSRRPKPAMAGATGPFQ